MRALVAILVLVLAFVCCPCSPVIAEGEAEKTNVAAQDDEVAGSDAEKRAADGKDATGSASGDEKPTFIHAGGLSGDALYAIGGDQQEELISIQHLMLSKSGIDFDYKEYDTMQEGFEALQRGEIDTLYPMTPYARDLEPRGLVASDGVYTVSWEIIFTGDYDEHKLDTVAVPGGRLAPFYCAEVFPESKQVKCGSRLECLDAVLDGRADSAVFNGFQTENIVQNGRKYSKLCYTVLPTDTPMVFALRKEDTALRKVINDCIAQTSELEKTDYMVKSRVVGIEESTRAMLVARYQVYIVAICAAVAILGIGLIIIMRKVIMPLREFTRCMESNERLPIIGASNLRQMATTYNRLFDETARTQDLLQHEAEHDALTGLLNRKAYEQCLEHFDRTGEPYLLTVFDLDRFKSVNDTYGHAVGDKVLKKVADALVEMFRTGDYVCRIGGDEFVVVAIQPQHGLVDVMAKKVDRVNALLANDADGVPKLTVSAGAALHETGLTGDDVYRRADAVLYEVKTNGRGGFKMYDGSVI